MNEKVCDLVCTRDSKLAFPKGVLAEGRGQKTERFVRKDLEAGPNSI